MLGPEAVSDYKSVKRTVMWIGHFLSVVLDGVLFLTWINTGRCTHTYAYRATAWT